MAKEYDSMMEFVKDLETYCLDSNKKYPIMLTKSIPPIDGNPLAEWKISIQANGETKHFTLDPWMWIEDGKFMRVSVCVVDDAYEFIATHLVAPTSGELPRLLCS